MSLKPLKDLVAETKANLHCLSPEAAADVLKEDSNALIIDVREPGEVAEKSPAGTINIPRGVLEMKITDYTMDPDCPIYLHCASGGRAALAASALEHMGFNNVSILDASCDDLITHLGAAS